MSSTTSLMDIDSSKPSFIGISEEIEQDKEAKWFDLYPNKDLLDPSFEGYKLSLDSFSQYKMMLEGPYQLDTYNLIESAESKLKYLLYQHLKLFGFQNLLFVNHFKDSDIYYLDKRFCLNKIIYVDGNIPRSIVSTTLQLPPNNIKERTHVSMKFVRDNLAVFFDGHSNLYFCEIVEQLRSDEYLKKPESWRIVFSWTAPKNESTSVLKDAIFFENNLHVMLIYVDEVVDSKRINKFDTIINWLQFDCSNEFSQINLKRTRKLNCYTSVPDYITFETNGSAINIVGPKSIEFVYDSALQIKINSPIIETKMEIGEPSNGEKFYSWHQTESEVLVVVRLDSVKNDTNAIEKSDLQVIIKPNSIEIDFKKKLIIRDQLFSKIRSDESTWSLCQNGLELILIKANSGEIWPYLLIDKDRFGQYKGEQVIEKTEILQSKGLFTCNQLDECDGLDERRMGEGIELSEENDLMLRRLDGNTHKCTHKCYINDNKFLMETRLSEKKCSALCLRHDVDGILWQPHRMSEENEVVWLTHEHTFLAFGYVQASKQEAKFCLAPPNCSYVCVVDAKKHIYVYKQDGEKVIGALRNRKTGKFMSHVAKQYLISLDVDYEIYGAYAANDFLLILLRDFCFIFRINTDNK